MENIFEVKGHDFKILECPQGVYRIACDEAGEIREANQYCLDNYYNGNPQRFYHACVIDWLENYF